jgi:GPH family glycoside/pentoside/hexuronide:cation symporter
MAETPPEASMPPKRRISAVSKYSYAIGAVAFGLKGVALAQLMLFYNQVLGLPASWVSVVIGIALIVDAIVDPLIGQVSDTWRSRWGRRHPFMYASAVPATVAVWALLNPPQGWSHEALVAYLLTCVVAARISISMFEIPSASLLPELAHDYDDRTVLSTWRSLFGLVLPIAIVVFAMTVLMTPFVNAQGQAMPGQLNPAGYAKYGVLLAAVIFLSIMLSALGTHREIKHLSAPVPHASVAELFATIRATLLDRNFLALAVAGIVAGIGTGLVGGLNEYFNTYFWELSAAQISSITGGLLISPIAGAMSSQYFAKRFGKKRVVMTAYFLAIFFGLLPICLRLLGWLPPNGSPVIVVLLAVDTTVAVALAVIAVILGTSMMADIVEQVQTKTGQRSEGLIFSADTMVKQIVTGVGSMGTGLILTLIAFPQAAVPGQVPAEVLHRLALVYMPITLVTNCLAIFAISFYSIGREEHESNLARIGVAGKAAR